MGIKQLWRGDGGWSLVELTITLTLAGLITALALPAFVQWGDRQEREGFLGLLAEDIRLAQRKAQIGEVDVYLKVNREGSSYAVYQGKQRLSRGTAPAGTRLTSNFPSGQLVFRPSGQSRGGTFQLMQGKEIVGRVVVQVASGRPRVEVQP